MCNKVVHLEPEEFMKILQKEQLSVPEFTSLILGLPV